MPQNTGDEESLPQNRGDLDPIASWPGEDHIIATLAGASIYVRINMHVYIYIYIYIACTKI